MQYEAEDEARALIGRRMKAARMAVGMSQRQAGNALGGQEIQRQTISAWERGEYLPTVPQLCAMCLRYGASADLILFGLETIAVGGGPMIEKVFRDRRLAEVDQPFRY